MSDARKGFNVTIGVLFALFVVFVILPIGTCIGCTMCTAGMGAVGQVAQEQEKAKVADEGPAIAIENSAFKVLDENPFLHEITYKFDVKNNRARDLRQSFKVAFHDDDGLVIDEDLILSETIAAGSTRTFTGKTMIEPKKSARIASMVVVEN